jgi:hypothetical protein
LASLAEEPGHLPFHWSSRSYSQNGIHALSPFSGPHMRVFPANSASRIKQRPRCRVRQPLSLVGVTRIAQTFSSNQGKRSPSAAISAPRGLSSVRKSVHENEHSQGRHASQAIGRKKKMIGRYLGGHPCALHHRSHNNCGTPSVPVRINVRSSLHAIDPWGLRKVYLVGVIFLSLSGDRHQLT